MEQKALNFLQSLKKEKKILDFAVKSETNKKNVCANPFTVISIRNNGDVYTCCPDYIRHNKIGNIFQEKSLRKIWYGEKAEELRKKLINNDYSMCNLDICSFRQDIDVSMFPDKLSAPKIIYLSYDRECNLSCITCRDKIIHNSKEKLALYEEIYTYIEPVIKEAELISISGAGEPFFSRHSKELIKKISALNKKAKWNIITNGILFTSENCRKLGIYGRINQAAVSLPAMSREIYGKITRGGNYDAVIKNIKEAAYEQNYNKSIKYVRINAVISSINYKEIIKIAEFAADLNIYLTITQFYHVSTAEFGSDYKSVSVWDKEHPEYENFIKILKHPALSYDKIFFTPKLRQIRKML